MKKRARSFLTSVIILVATTQSLSALLRAQTTFGSFLGTISDTSQAGMPAATVTVTNIETGVSRHKI